MTRSEALGFWKRRYEDSKDYYDPYWDAEERHAHREYVQALEWAIKALTAEQTEPQEREGE